MTTDPYAAYQARRWFQALDGFRALAVLAVVAHHTTQAPAWLVAGGRGFLGVDMFFVISGFLIVTLLLRERARTGTVSLRQFYLRRTLRIFPVYYGLLAALTLLFLLKPSLGTADAFFHELPYYLTYTSNWVEVSALAVMWSLAAEEQFYLLWPPLERWAPRLVPAALIGVLAVNQLINYELLNAPLAALGLHYARLEILQATFTPIALGVGLAHLLHRPEGFARLYRLLGRPAAAPALAGLLLVVLSLPHAHIGGTHRLVLQLTMVCLLGACVVREDHALPRALAWKPLARIGVVSYGIYLFHMPLRNLLAQVLDRVAPDTPGLLFPLCAVAAYATAECSFRLYERPFLTLKSRLSPPATRLQAPK